MRDVGDLTRSLPLKARDAGVDIVIRQTGPQGKAETVSKAVGECSGSRDRFGSPLRGSARL